MDTDAHRWEKAPSFARQAVDVISFRLALDRFV
jgi:hypothetical protein